LEQTSGIVFTPPANYYIACKENLFLSHLVYPEELQVQIPAYCILDKLTIVDVTLGLDSTIFVLDQAGIIRLLMGARFELLGNQDPSFSFPQGICAVPDTLSEITYLFVADTYNRRIVRLTV